MFVLVETVFMNTSYRYISLRTRTRPAVWIGEQERSRM